MKLTWDEQILIDCYRNCDDMGKVSMIETGRIFWNIKKQGTLYAKKELEPEKENRTLHIVKNSKKAVDERAVSDVRITEAMFNRYSEEKQKKLLLELFSNIRDKGYFYEFGLTVYAREQKEKL